MNRKLVFSALLLLLPLSRALAQQDNPQHESELTQASFPPLTLEPEIFSFPDEDFVRVAVKIQLGIASMQERRWWYRAAERYAPFQGVPAPDWPLQAARSAARLDPTLKSMTAASSAPLIFNWASLGPNGDYDVTGQTGPPGSKDQGRATAIWTHLDGATLVNKNIIFLGTADGGLWKSTDGGDHWKPLLDNQPTLSVGSLDVLPGQDLVNYSDATVYVGTGEGNFSISDKDGMGVLKSTDGGATWTLQTLPWRGDTLGLPGLHRIRRLRIDRNVPNGQSVWIAGDGGVYHSADGGGTWSLVTGLPYSGAPAGSAFPGGCWTEYPTDFAVDTIDRVNGHSMLLAVYGRYADSACAATPADARKNNGIYRSTDGGATWTKISVSGTNGFPDLPGNVGRISLLSAPSNPKHVYALIARADDYESLGIFDTLDATANPVVWSAGSTTSFTNGQGWYDLTGAVDPGNENRIMVGGLDNYVSDDRGATLTQVSGWSASDETWAHADHHHAVWVDAHTYYDANDGGLNVGRIDGASVTWTHKNAGSLSTLQFYGLGQSAADPYKINAGLQDNGHAFLSGGLWRETVGGDGGFAATDQTNDNEAYSEYVYGSIRNSDDGGNSWPAAGCMQTFGACTGCLGLCVPDNHTAFIANFMLDVHNQNVMYVGTNYLYRNTDASGLGKVWTRIASDGVNGDFVKGDASGAAYISIIHTPQASPVAGVSLLGSPAISQILYVGTSRGRIWKSTDGGSTWTDLTKPPLPVNGLTTGRYLTWIDTDPNDANKVVLTYSGWSASTSPAIPGHVFRSLDGGATWADISGALPDEPFNAVAVNPNPGATNEIYVASDTGVFVNTDGWTGTSWLRTNSGLLPNVSVNMLQFTNATTPKRLRAATHGRGIWELFKQSASQVTLDRPSYGCNDTLQIAVVTGTRGAGTQTVTVSSGAETSPETVTLNEFPAGSGHYAGTLATSGGSAVHGDGRITVFNADTITVRYTDAGGQQITARAATDCNTCDAPVSTAAGANLKINEASAALTIQGGDGDEFLDNCETGKVSFSLRNIGAGSLTNLRISNVTPSNPAVRIPVLPSPIAPSLAQCATASGAFTFNAAGLAPGEALELKIDVTSDELAARGIVRSLTVRYPQTEQDFHFESSKTFSFETGLEGWQPVRGTFTRTNAGIGGASLTSYYLASSSLTDGACDEIRSPLVKLSSTSTLSLFNQFVIEPISDAWYDRANVGIFDPATGTRTNVAPSGGRTYLASGPNGVCVTGGQPGWAGPGPGWLESTWSAADLQAPAWSGKKVQLDVAYGTDSSASLTGFQFDQVTLTNFEQQVADGQDNVCRACGDLDDSDPAVEYTGGWHLKSDPAASGGSYHRRTGNNPQGAVARLVFSGRGITYLYSASNAGGTADVYLDGVFRQRLSYAGSGFGHAVTYSGLGSGSHEIRIVHVAGMVTVDGFRIDCGVGTQAGTGADAAAAHYHSETQTSTGSASEGAVLTRTVQIGANDVGVSVVVEGSTLPLTVKLLGPLGNLIASGGSLIPGLSLSGLDANVSAPGLYTVQVVNTLTPGQTVGISIARTVHVP
jgi:hypothetical protein